MIYFNVPTFYNFEWVYILLNQYKHLFKPDREISSIYGNFNGNIWNGGRLLNSDPIEIKKIEETFKKYYEEIKIPIELTCNNIALTEEHYKDKYANQIMEIANEYGITVIVADENLKRYIQDNYHNIKFKKSCINYNGNDIKDYEMIVMNQFLNSDMNNFIKIPENIRSKIEIICNAECDERCVDFKKHHKCMSECQIKGYSETSFNCLIENQMFPIHEALRRKHFISNDKIGELEKLGYNHFKIVGRNFHPQALYFMAYYLIQDEYIIDIFSWEMLNCLEEIIAQMEPYKI